MQCQHIGRRQRKTDVVRRNLFREAMNRVELRDGLPVCVVKPFRRQRTLADVDDHERDIHVAFHHLRQIDLRGEAHFVVAIRGEVRRLDIVVRVELEDPVVNDFGFGDQCRIIGLRRAGPGRDLEQQADSRRRHAGNPELSLDIFHCFLLVP